MFRLNKEKEQKAARSLQANPAFRTVLETLSEEKELSIKGLMVAKAENVGQLQGRTQLLEELLEALKFNYQPN